MASSNKHWPSMFKSKPCNSPHHQWQHGINSSLNSSISCNRFPHAPGYVCEERTPDPKPRWNPRPEQIRILETIFNSGMVNPPRDEIRKIRVQLQEYGQVGDANVFYWFQNRKSRSKHRQKQRQLRTTKAQLQPATASNVASAPSPSSSSSDKSSANNSAEKSLSLGPTTVINLLNSPIASVNQTFFHAYSDVMAVPFLFPGQQNIGGSSSSNLTQDFCFPLEGDQNPSFLFSELKLMSSCLSKKDGEEKKNHQQQFRYTGSPPSHTIAPPPYPLASPATDQLLQECGGTKSTVFINDVCMEVGIGPFNVRQVFGDEAVLIESSGQAVVTDERGVTLQPLRHGAFYYLLLPFMAKPPFIW